MKQQEIVNKAKNEGNRSLTPEEQRSYDSLQREIEKLSREDQEEETIPEETENNENRGLAEERTRVTEITTLCREFELDPLEYINNGSSLDQVRAIILKKIKEDGEPVHVNVIRDAEDKFRECASDALLLRAGVNTQTIEGARELQTMSLRDLAIECMAREGQDTHALLRMRSDDMYNELCRQFYNPTAAFPSILDNTIKKSIVQIYEQVPTTYQAWTSKGSLKDFKETSDHEYVIGGEGDFLKVPENGELKADKPKIGRAHV